MKKGIIFSTYIFYVICTSVKNGKDNSLMLCNCNSNVLSVRCEKYCQASASLKETSNKDMKVGNDKSGVNESVNLKSGGVKSKGDESANTKPETIKEIINGSNLVEGKKGKDNLINGSNLVEREKMKDNLINGSGLVEGLKLSNNAIGGSSLLEKSKLDDGSIYAPPVEVNKRPFFNFIKSKIFRQETPIVEPTYRIDNGLLTYNNRAYNVCDLVKWSNTQNIKNNIDTLSEDVRQLYNIVLNNVDRNSCTSNAISTVSIPSNASDNVIIPFKNIPRPINNNVLPTNTLSGLPTNALSGLPTNALSGLPTNTISTLPTNTTSSLRKTARDDIDSSDSDDYNEMNHKRRRRHSPYRRFDPYFAPYEYPPGLMNTFPYRQMFDNQPDLAFPPVLTKTIYIENNSTPQNTVLDEKTVYHHDKEEESKSTVTVTTTFTTTSTINYKDNSLSNNDVRSTSTIYINSSSTSKEVPTKTITSTVNSSSLSDKIEKIPLSVPKKNESSFLKGNLPPDVNTSVENTDINPAELIGNSQTIETPNESEDSALDKSKVPLKTIRIVTPVIKTRSINERSEPKKEGQGSSNERPGLSDERPGLSDERPGSGNEIPKLGYESQGSINKKSGAKSESSGSDNGKLEGKFNVLINRMKKIEDIVSSKEDNGSQKSSKKKYKEVECEDVKKKSKKNTKRKSPEKFEDSQESEQEEQSDEDNTEKTDINKVIESLSNVLKRIETIFMKKPTEKNNEDIVKLLQDILKELKKISSDSNTKKDKAKKAQSEDDKDTTSTISKRFFQKKSKTTPISRTRDAQTTSFESAIENKNFELLLKEIRELKMNEKMLLEMIKDVKKSENGLPSKNSTTYSSRNEKTASKDSVNGNTITLSWPITDGKSETQKSTQSTIDTDKKGGNNKSIKTVTLTSTLINVPFSNKIDDVISNQKNLDKKFKRLEEILSKQVSSIKTTPAQTIKDDDHKSASFNTKVITLTHTIYRNKDNQKFKSLYEKLPFLSSITKEEPKEESININKQRELPKSSEQEEQNVNIDQYNTVNYSKIEETPSIIEKVRNKINYYMQTAGTEEPSPTITPSRIQKIITFTKTLEKIQTETVTSTALSTTEKLKVQEKSVPVTVTTRLPIPTTKILTINKSIISTTSILKPVILKDTETINKLTTKYIMSTEVETTTSPVFETKSVTETSTVKDVVTETRAVTETSTVKDVVTETRAVTETSTVKDVVTETRAATETSTVKDIVTETKAVTSFSTIVNTLTKTVEATSTISEDNKSDSSNKETVSQDNKDSTVDKGGDDLKIDKKDESAHKPADDEVKNKPETIKPIESTKDQSTTSVAPKQTVIRTIIKRVRKNNKCKSYNKKGECEIEFDLTNAPGRLSMEVDNT